MMDSVLQAGIVSAPLQVLLDRFATLAVHETSLILDVDKENRKLERTLERVRHMAAHVEEGSRSIFSGTSWKLWLEDVDSLSHSADDLLDGISLDLSRAITSPGDANKLRDMILSSFRLTVPREIRRIREELEGLEKEMEPLYNIEMKNKVSELPCSSSSSSSSLVECVVGRDKEVNEIVQMLMLVVGVGMPNVSVIPIVGMGGIGKTTLAQAVYNHSGLNPANGKAKAVFDLKMWASVSMDFDPIRVTKSIIESASGERCKLSGLDPVQVKLSQLLRGKRFLLVLDDYWSEEYGDWDLLSLPFRVGSKGSKVLLTTRSLKVSMITGSVPFYGLEGLSDGACWDLLKGRAGSINAWNDFQLEELGRAIARKCKGLPLAAKTIGSMLRFKYDPAEWNSVLLSEIWDTPHYENDIFPALSLSYNLLPAHLKKCFGYCSIFPKNYNFEMNELVLLWMAEGFIRPCGNIRAEDLGNDYFKELVWRSFFQRSHVNMHGVIIYKMHDLIHSMAQLITAHMCLHLEDTHTNEDCLLSINTRHLSFHCVSAQPTALKVSLWYKSLRTFRVINENVGMQVTYDLFLKLKSLRVLDLSHTGLDELPDTICHLKHLRYLNLSQNHFRNLPESVTNLFTLQTLKLEQCFQLLELSSNMKNMVSLRHLHLNVRQLNSMPPEFGKLADLQNLSAFIVGRNQGCGIGELKNMKFLRGSLCIKNLENVSNVAEAGEAMLHMKPFLAKLELEWNGPTINDGEILAGLRPHENLKELSVTNYNGFLLPSWFSDPLCKLSSIYLRSCRNNQILDPLAKLQHLKSLVIEDMLNWPKVYQQFSGFRSLESLTIKDMPNLSHWGQFRGSRFPFLRDFVIEDCPMLTNLPSLMDTVLLQTLSISRCPRIKSLPNDGLPVSLQTLKISESDIIKDRCRVEEGEDWWKIISIRKIEIDYVEIPWENRRL